MRTTLKLVLPLIISVALVSLLFAAYQVRTQRRNLRTDLSRRAELLAALVKAKATRLYPGWASQQAFCLDEPAVSAIEVLLPRRGPAKSRRAAMS